MSDWKRLLIVFIAYLMVLLTVRALWLTYSYWGIVLSLAVFVFISCGVRWLISQAGESTP